MKKWMFIVLVVLAVVVLLVVLIFKYGSFGNGCPPPDKPKNVPITAVWKGDCDGGSWIELVVIKKDKYRFRIYRDWNGELILDADFEHIDCETFSITKSNWSKHIAYFKNNLEIYGSSNAARRCKLVPIYPVYYEEQLE